jgi:hypothetical protein
MVVRKASKLVDLQGRLDSEVAESGTVGCWLELQGIPRSGKWEVSADF